MKYGDSGLFSDLAAAAAKSIQSCRTLCDPIDGSPSGSTIPGIPQARTLEWVAIAFSSIYLQGCKKKKKLNFKVFWWDVCSFLGPNPHYYLFTPFVS